MVNWCPGLGTVLANEEVTADGRSDRGNFPVFRKHLQQWMMRITAYSDRLVDDLEYLDWPDKVKTMQRNWIGRSHGAQVYGFAGGRVIGIEVFTTRPDTLFGATYVTLAPEHELVDELVAAEWPEGVDSRWTGGAATPAEAVAAYRKSIAAKSDLERQEYKEKTGVFLGTYAVNPVNGHKLPVFIADYVLTGYGTGAIMAVPGHDHRDYEFATEFGLDIVEVISGGDLAEDAYTGDGTIVNSDFLNGHERRRRQEGRSPSASRRTAPARAPSSTSCATGCSRASGTGASRSRSCTTPTATRTPCRNRLCRWNSRRSRTTHPCRSIPTTRPRSPLPRWRRPSTGSTSNSTSATDCRRTAATPT